MKTERMATCKDCFHWGLCDGVFYSQGADGCSSWADKANTIEVVRCKDCKHWLHMEDGFGDCTNGRFHLDGHADPTMNADDFCSCGERRADSE